jgi:hypothetical protein
VSREPGSRGRRESDEYGVGGVHEALALDRHKGPGRRVNGKGAEKLVGEDGSGGLGRTDLVAVAWDPAGDKEQTASGMRKLGVGRHWGGGSRRGHLAGSEALSRGWLGDVVRKREGRRRLVSVETKREGRVVASYTPERLGQNGADGLMDWKMAHVRRRLASCLKCLKGWKGVAPHIALKTMMYISVKWSLLSDLF